MTGAAITATSITFGSSTNAYVLGGNSINLSGSVLNSSPAPQTINMALGLTADVSFGGGTAGLTIGGVISGAHNIATTGTVTFLAADTFSGTTTISSGTLSIGTAGSLSSTTSIAVSSGSTLLNGGGGQFGLGTGEVRPTPEPSTVLVGLRLMVCYREGWFRRRHRSSPATRTASR